MTMAACAAGSLNLHSRCDSVVSYTSHTLSVLFRTVAVASIHMSQLLRRDVTLAREVEADVDLQRRSWEVAWQRGQGRRLGDGSHRDAVVVRIAAALLDRYVGDLAVAADLKRDHRLASRKRTTLPALGDRALHYRKVLRERGLGGLWHRAPGARCEEQHGNQRSSPSTLHHRLSSLVIVSNAARC